MIEAIEANIKTNNERAITGQVLQDVLVDIVGVAEQGDEEIVSVIDTNITPAINGLAESKLDKTTYDAFVADVGEALAEKATTAEVREAQNAAFTNAMSYTNAATQDKSTWVSIRSVLASSDNISVTIQPNAFYDISGALSQLSVAIQSNENTQNVLELSTYALQFYTAEEVSSIVFPSWWKFPEGVAFEANKTYQVTCVNGYALVSSWANS